MEIEQKLTELASFTPKHEVLNPKVSKANVAWHIGHSLRVVNGVCSLLATAEPTEYRPKFSWQWQYVKLTQRFPRGKAKAPKGTIPPEETTENDLRELLEKTRKKLDTLRETTPKGAFFDHPYFGHLTYKEGLYFLAIHTHHHIKIIRDILKN